MSTSHRHLDHLSTILNENGNLLQRRPLSQLNLQEFLDALALDRVHLDRTDWQGHSVNTLVGHLPNLKPAVKTSLSRFILDKWKAQDSDNTARLTINETDVSALTVNRAVDTLLTTTHVEKSSSIVPQQPGISLVMPVSRSDWFDRFTDWVVALISLLK